MIPKKLGFSMPAEYSMHMGTWMEWPVRDAGWPGEFTEILKAYSDAVKAVASFEPVILIVRPDTVTEARSYLGDVVKYFEIQHDDSWMRDNGPTFLKNEEGALTGVNWIFNAWGGKYPSDKDNMVAEIVLSTLEVPIFDAPFVMEGGSIHTDGEGTLLTTEQCLLNANRNPDKRKEEIEALLMDYTGTDKVIWLKNGLVGDDTDGHIDNVACFAAPGKIIFQDCNDPENPNYHRAKENLEALRAASDAKGRAFEIICVEQPAADAYEDMSLTLSYLNFYFVNGGIILPVFGGKHTETDKIAVDTISGAFPDRKVVTIDGYPLARGGGNIHCLTQQMPAGMPATLSAQESK